MPQKDPEELVRLEKVNFSDDEDDDGFQYAAVDDDGGLGGSVSGLNASGTGVGVLDDDEEEEEDFAAVLRNLNKSTAARGPSDVSASAPSDSDGVLNDGGRRHSQQQSSLSSSSSSPNQNVPHTQVRPAVVDDFVRNFLIKVGMARTLDAFNHEWYELVAKGKLQEEDVGVVPDIYARNEALDAQVKELRRTLDETQRVTEKAKGTWDKFRQQRDVHKMHHQRVLQEKDALAGKIRKLEKHVAAYEPLLQELRAKYENSMKEKMLMRLERDRQAAKAEALEAQLKALASASTSAASSSSSGQSRGASSAPGASSSSSSTGPSLTALSTSSKGSSKSGGKKKTDSGSSSSAASSGSSTATEAAKLPGDGVNPFVDKRFEPAAAERMELVKTLPAHGQSVAALAFHPRNAIVATASDDATWKLWSAPAGELIMSGEGHRSWLAGVAFHPRGSHVATSSGDNTVKLWDFVGAACALTLADHAHPVWESAFHHDGDFLVSASMDHTCKLWDLSTGRCRRTLRGHVDSVNSVCFQPFTSNVCSASGDKTVSVWDLRAGLCVQTFYGHQNACNSVSAALQGDALVSCDADGFVKVWDVRMVAERASLDGGHSPLNSVALDRSGKVLAAACDDGSVKLFSLKTDALVSELRGHEGPVQVRGSLCMSVANALMAVGDSRVAVCARLVRQVRPEWPLPGLVQLRLHAAPVVRVGARAKTDASTMQSRVVSFIYSLDRALACCRLAPRRHLSLPASAACDFYT